MALSDQLQTVRSWFASTPGANPNPSEEDLKYYAEQGIGKFLTDVASIRTANPQLATELDKQRAAMAASGSPFGSITGSMFNIPGAVRTNYVPFSALLQPMGTRGFGNYGYGPGMMSAEQPKPAEPIPQPPLPSQTSSFPTFDLNAWYNPPASANANVSTQAGLMGNQASQLAMIIAAIQAALTGQKPASVTSKTAAVPSAEQLKSVSDLYASINRLGDQEGINYWTGRLASGESLTDVSNAFRASANYVKQQEEQRQKDSSVPSASKTATDATAMPVQVTQTTQPTASNNRLEDIRQAFLSIPGANPNPDREALEYYASQGVDKLMADVAFIRAANPEIAARIDAERSQLGLS